MKRNGIDLLKIIEIENGYYPLTKQEKVICIVGILWIITILIYNFGGK